MSKSLMYEVWSVHEDGSYGVFLCMSTEMMCRQYIEQAIEKGADPNSLAIINADDSPFETSEEVKPEWFGNH